MPFHPLSIVPFTLYRVKTRVVLKVSPIFRSVGDRRVPVFLLISRFLRTIRIGSTLPFSNRESIQLM